jgi:hypothetical protein
MKRRIFCLATAPHSADAATASMSHDNISETITAPGHRPRSWGAGLASLEVGNLPIDLIAALRPSPRAV